MEEEIKRDRRGRVQHGSSYRAKMLSLYKSGDLSRPDFCRKHGLAYTTFSTWVLSSQDKGEESRLLSHNERSQLKASESRLGFKEVDLSSFGEAVFIHMRLRSGHELRIPSSMIGQLPRFINDLEGSHVDAQ